MDHVKKDTHHLLRILSIRIFSVRIFSIHSAKINMMCGDRSCDVTASKNTRAVESARLIRIRLINPESPTRLTRTCFTLQALSLNRDGIIQWLPLIYINAFYCFFWGISMRRISVACGAPPRPRSYSRSSCTSCRGSNQQIWKWQIQDSYLNVACSSGSASVSNVHAEPVSSKYSYDVGAVVKKKP
jgi:hypothetical protein